MLDESKLTIYFDMDGVLAKFETFGGLPMEQRPFMVPGSHYFRTCEPDHHAVELFNRLQTKHECQVRILTRLLPVDAMFEEWRADKLAWCHEMLANFRDGQFITLDRKAEVLGPVPMESRKYHVLIDDFNENLTAWRDAGGTAVKYCNGLNTPETWPGARTGPKSPERLTCPGHVLFAPDQPRIK